MNPNKRLTRERARSVVATPQERLFRARVALKQAATLCREAASLGTMSDASRSVLICDARDFDEQAAMLRVVEARINEHKSSLRARRSRKAA